MVGNIVGTGIVGVSRSQDANVSFLPNGLIEGNFEHIEGYKFRFKAQKYVLNNLGYTQIIDQVIELSPSDDLLNRTDLVIVEISNGVKKISVIEGIFSEGFAKPLLENTDTQIEFTAINVPAGSVSPSGIKKTLVYDENVGSAGGEFDVSTTSPWIDIDSLEAPFSGTKSIEFEYQEKGDVINFQTTTPFTTQGKNLVFKYKKKDYRIAMSANYMTFVFGGELVTVKENSQFGLFQNGTDYQSVIVPLSGLNPTTLHNGFQIRMDKVGAGFYLDQIQFQEGTQNPLDGYLPRGGYTGTAQDIVDMFESLTPGEDYGLELGETATKAFRGDLGKEVYDAVKEAEEFDFAQLLTNSLNF